MTMTEDEILGRIKMGVNVDIKRSDGRIHSAVVSGINIDTRSVTVEWFERGETKGKEVELETLLSLNQDLAPVNNDNGNNKNAKHPTPNSTAGKTSSSSQNSLSQTRSYVPRPSVTPSNRATTTAAVTGSTTGGPRGGGGTVVGGRGNKVRQTMNGIDIQEKNTANNYEEKQQNGSENVPPPPPPATRGETKKSTIPPENMETVSKGTGAKKHKTENVPPPPATKGETKKSTIPPENMETLSKDTGAKLRSVSLTDRRRSNVVKEIDRLKKNREDRRAKQAEILEEKSAKQNVDPGNPNWEFLCMIRDYQETLDFNPLQDGDDYLDHQITVCVRKRPLSKKEDKRKETDVITVPNQNQVIAHEPKTKVDLTKYLENQHFRFDTVFDETAGNELVYKYTARPLVQNIFEGGMATCFAYGQTGSGKTHTMGGEFHGKTQDSKNGIYALATKDVFKYLTSPKYKTLKLQVSCSYFEIYSGKVFDLLSGKSKLRVLEDGKQQVQVVGLTESVVTCVEDVLKLITSGNNIRTSGQTSANQHSSRSHAVFQIILRTPTAKKPLHGKFSLIDLAGNERGADTSSANRQTRMEGAEINKSLLALKECIRALGRKGSHLPFRASKLTQVLRDSFIGNKSKTCMIAMVSPGLASCEHTLNTLRYADRVKELGAAEPANQQAKSSPTEGPEGMRMDDGVMSPEELQDSDLAQLRSLNQGELSADWYNFQEAISHLQALEDELVEAHRATIQNMLKWTKEDASLLAMTNEVDYDQDAYCQQLEDMISEKIEAFSELREKARNFRSCMRDEEAKSRLLMHRN